jgi:hypothetical protein
MRKTLFGAAVVAAALGWATPSSASTILFDIDGPGVTTVGTAVTKLDWAPGNTLLQETGATTANILFQANLGSAIPGVSQGSGGSYIDVTGDLTGTATGFPGVFKIDAGGIINVYADTTPEASNGAKTLPVLVSPTAR